MCGAYGTNRWRSAWAARSFKPRRNDPMTGQTQRGRSLNSSFAIRDANSTTQTPSPGDA